MAREVRCEPFSGFPPRVPAGWEMHVHPHVVEDRGGEQYVRSFYGAECGAPKFVPATSPMAEFRGVPRGERSR